MADDGSLVRKRLGQFYTPRSEAASLARWAVRTGMEKILEPSAGDGALLAPALARAAMLSATPPIAVAVDIDQTATDALSGRFGEAVEIINDDFFNRSASEIKPVDVILANPPFSRNQQIPPAMRAALRKRFPIRGAAGLWTYFILHARHFLRPGGRMAVVVPASACFADYAQDLLVQLRADFREVSLFELPSKPDWIGGADERGALLLAEGWQAGPAATVKRGVWSYEIGAPRPTSAPPLPSYRRLLAASRPLASMAALSIGVVTGANRVLLLSQKEVESTGIAREDLVQIVTRSRQAPALRFGRDDLAAASPTEKVWLLSPRTLGPRGGAIRRRLALIGPRARRTTAWLNKRSPWWRVQTLPAGDAVFTYMNDRGPRICLLDPGLLCTNTLHSIRFNGEVTEEERWATALSMISTFGQLAAESRGRSYGGGVLKFELREARSFPILPPSSSSTRDAFVAADKALRAGLPGLAQDIADKALVSPILGRGWKLAVGEMKLILEAAQAARRRGDARAVEVDLYG